MSLKRKKTQFRRTNIFAHISGGVARQVLVTATPTTSSTSMATTMPRTTLTTAKKDREFSCLCSRYSHGHGPTPYSPAKPCPALPWPFSLFCGAPILPIFCSATKSKAFRPKNFSKVREQRNRQTWKDQVTRERLRPSPGGGERIEMAD